MIRTLERIFDFLASLKLAVIVLLGFTVALVVATLLESAYDTQTGQYYVYRAWWFKALLVFLGINIFCVAMSRWPWKRKHIPFLLAHLGILILLFGSWQTDRFGLDGSLRVSEGQTSAVVDEALFQLVFSSPGATEAVAHLIDWIPPGKEFKPFVIKDGVTGTSSSGEGPLPPLEVREYISRAEPVIGFRVPSTAEQATLGETPRPALKFKLEVPPSSKSKIPPGMRSLLAAQSFWLWQSDGGWASVNAGPARFAILDEEQARAVAPKEGAPQLLFFEGKKGDLEFRHISSQGKSQFGKTGVTFKSSEEKSPIRFNPNWNGIEVVIERWMPRAIPDTKYTPSKIQFGKEAPPPAIRVGLLGSSDPGVWLGVGDQATLGTLRIGFFQKRLVLPFSVKLHEFEIKRYQGSVDPSSYASRVSILDQQAPPETQEVWIRMNEPLSYKGITLYQASYEDADPRPVTSIFSVNRDPGRQAKYAGSLLIVLGSVLLFARRYPVVGKLLGVYEGKA